MGMTGGSTSFISNQTMSNAAFGFNFAHRALFDENVPTALAAMIATAFVSVASMGMVSPEQPLFAALDCRDTPYSIMSCQ